MSALDQEFESFPRTIDDRGLIYFGRRNVERLAGPLQAVNTAEVLSGAQEETLRNVLASEQWSNDRGVAKEWADRFTSFFREAARQESTLLLVH